MSRRSVLSIGELTREIKQWLEQNDTLRDVWVRGEISNFKHHSRGHMYFTLKDDTSQIRAVMFRGNNQFLKFAPKDGMSVFARGEVNVYERSGQYQFYVRDLQPDGIGALYQAYEDLKRKLEQRGWFDSALKKSPPAVPRKIGIITSPTGAAIRDMLTTIHRRFPIAAVSVLPVLVQGKQAAPSVAKAIRLAHREDFDVLIVGRGGGSIEELWAFNEEIVAKAIYEAQIPVISAVGHETDFTIADFVADKRAATPTAAAEMAVPVLFELNEHVSRLRKVLVKSMQRKIDTERQTLTRLRTSYAFKYPRQLLHQKEQELDEKLNQLKKSIRRYRDTKRNEWRNIYRRLRFVHPGSHIRQAKRDHGQLTEKLHKEMSRSMELHKERLRTLSLQLDALSPLKTMQKGFSLVYDEHQKVLYRSVRSVHPGQTVSVRMHDGTLDCHVWGIKEDGEEHDSDRSR